MTDSMVERVARAMYPRGWEQDGHFNSRDRAWRREHALIAARAAIEAMRTPTPEMVKQGARSMAVMSPTNEAEYEAISEVWQDMITAALGGKI